MPADKVVSLAARRQENSARLAAVADHAHRHDELENVPLVVQAAPGSVSLIAPGCDLVFSPDQAFELAKDIWNAAREAKEAGNRG